MAHEIGHAVDHYGQTVKRGNILGRLYSLLKYMKNTISLDSVTNKEYRDELWALSQWWKPFDPAKATETYVKYRKSSVEFTRTPFPFF
jgi:hypothetical protein